MSDNTILGALQRMGPLGRMTEHGFHGVASTKLHEMDSRRRAAQMPHLKRNRVACASKDSKYLRQRAAMMRTRASARDCGAMSDFRRCRPRRLEADHRIELGGVDCKSQQIMPAGCGPGRTTVYAHGLSSTHRRRLLPARGQIRE